MRRLPCVEIGDLPELQSRNQVKRSVITVLEKLRLKPPKNSTFESIIENLQKSRRLTGFYSTRRFAVVVGKSREHGFYEEFEGAWRRNPERPDLICAWRDDVALADFLKKKEANTTWRNVQVADYEAKNPKLKEQNLGLYNAAILRIERQMPYASEELRESAVLCLEFDLEQLQAYVGMHEQECMEKLGVLPSVPQLVPIWRDRSIRDYQPLVKIWFT